MTGKRDCYEIHKRMDELDLKYLRRVIYRMYDDGTLAREGVKSQMVYFLAK